MDRVAAGLAGHSRLEMVWLELTTRCNLHCRHCYADAGPAAPAQGRMALDDWRAAIDEALDLGVRAVQFIGGEPTLHPHFRELLAHAARASLELIEVYTNAAHGWCPPDSGVYNEGQAEKAWTRLLALYSKALA